MDMLRRIGVFLGWLTSALAGITATFYGFGFIASISHNGLLGLNWAATSRDAVWYLGLGATALGAWAVVAAIVLPVALIVVETARWLCRRAASSYGGWLGAPARWLSAHILWVVALCLGLLNLWLLSVMAPVTGVDQLLFAPRDTVCGAPGLIGELARGDTEPLRIRAVGLLALATLIVTLAGYVLPGAAGSPVPLAICAVAAFNATLAVPMVYGHLLLKLDLRPITETAALPAPFDQRALYLVASAKDGIWAWEAGARQVHWIGKPAFAHLGFGPASTIDAAICR